MCPAVLVKSRGTRQDVSGFRQAGETEIPASFQPGKGNCGHGFRVGNGIQGHLRLIRPVARPGVDTGLSPLVIDDHAAAVLKRVNPVQPDGKLHIADNQAGVFFHVHHFKRRPLQFQFQPFTQHLRQPFAFDGSETF